jgi:peptidyl-prolyl cis-trans isomerase B (cyclophilin B)
MQSMGSCSAVHRRLARTCAHTVFSIVILGLAVATSASAQQPRRPAAAPAQPARFKADLTAEPMKGQQAVVETPLGTFVLAFFPDKAPEHVRNFLRLASLGAYDGTAFHRVVRGFVIQGGMLHTRTDPVPQRAQRYVRTLAPEFNDTPHVKGILSMARTDDPTSASTAFFICTGPAPSLDGKYTAFGHVIDGVTAVEAIEAMPVEGEAPRERVEVTKVTVTSE